MNSNEEDTAWAWHSSSSVVSCMFSTSPVISATTIKANILALRPLIRPFGVPSTVRHELE